MTPLLYRIWQSLAMNRGAKTKFPSAAQAKVAEILQILTKTCGKLNGIRRFAPYSEKLSNTRESIEEKYLDDCSQSAGK